MPLMRPQYASRLLVSRASPFWQSQINNVRKASQTAGGHSEDRSIQPAPKSGASDPPAQAPGDSQMIKQEDAADSMVSHKPKFHAPIDHGTSYVYVHRKKQRTALIFEYSQFSPVPYRVMDGSEEGPMTPAAVLSGAPVDLQARTVR